MREKITKLSDYLIQGFLLAIIFTLPLWFDFYAWSFNVFALNKMILLRALLSLVLISFVVNILAQSKLSFAFPRKIFLVAGLLTTSMLISFLTSVDLGATLSGSYGRWQGFLAFVLYLIFFLVLIFKINTLAKINRLVVAAVYSSLLAALYGLVQFSAWDFFSWKETGRVFSTLGQPNFLGHFLVLVIPLTVYLIVVSKNNFKRFCYLFILLVQFACLVLTYSRAAWLDLFVSGLVLAGVLLFRLKKKQIIQIGLGFIAVIVLLASLTLFLPNKNLIGQTALVQRVQSAFDLESGSVKARLDFWQASLNIIQEMPPIRLLLGYGPDNLSNLFAAQYQTDWALNEFVGVWPDRAHNLLLDIILQFGYLGLLLYLSLITLVLVTSLAWLKNAQHDSRYWLVVFSLLSLLAYFVNNLFSFSSTTHYIYFYFIIAIIISLTARQDYYKISANLSRPGRLFIAIVPISLIFIFVFYYVFIPLRADHDYAFFARQGGQLDCSRRLALITQISRLVPSQDFYKNKELLSSVHCLVNTTEKNDWLKLNSNTSYLLDSLSAKSYNLKTLLSIAQAKSILSFYGQGKYQNLAQADFDYLLLNYPKISEVYKQAAYFQLRSGDYPAAIILLEKGIASLPTLDASFADPKYRIVLRQELLIFFEFLAFAYQKTGDEEQANYYNQIVTILKNN